MCGKNPRKAHRPATLPRPADRPFRSVHLAVATQNVMPSNIYFQNVHLVEFRGEDNTTIEEDNSGTRMKIYFVVLEL